MPIAEATGRPAEVSPEVTINPEVFALAAAFFAVRTKTNIQIQRRYSQPVDKATGVRADQKAYPNKLRRIAYLDVKTRKRFKFMNNNFHGTSGNAVKSRIWIAVSTYVIVAIIRKRLGVDA